MSKKAKKGTSVKNQAADIIPDDKKIGAPAPDQSASQLACIVQLRGRVAEAAGALAKAQQAKKFAQAEYDTAVASLLSKIDQPNLPGLELEAVDEFSSAVIATAVRIAIESGKCTVSLLQRRMELGYAMATRLVDKLHDIGAITAQNGDGVSRDVVWTSDDVDTFLATDSVLDPDAWRTVTLDALGITGREAKALTDADLATLGAIADYSKARSANGFEDGLSGVKGLGEAGRQRVQEQIDAYWEANPMPSETDESDDETEQEPGLKLAK